MGSAGEVESAEVDWGKNGSLHTAYIRTQRQGSKYANDGFHVSMGHATRRRYLSLESSQCEDVLMRERRDQESDMFVMHV